jgi:hypothetical protein
LAEYVISESVSVENIANNNLPEANSSSSQNQDESNESNTNANENTNDGDATKNPTEPDNTENDQGNLLIDSGFESISEWDINGPWRADVDNNDATIVGNAREGNGALRLTGNAGGNRSEIVLRGLPETGLKWYTEYWVGFSIKVVEVVGGYRIVKQFHAYPENFDFSTTAAANAFTMRTIDNNTLALLTSTNSDLTFECPTSPAAIGGQVSYTADFVLGEWTDIVLHFYLDTDSDGYFEAWVNGNKIIDIQNNPTIYRYDSGCAPKEPVDYPKIGAYYGTGNASGEIHYDSYRIWQGPGGSYEMVSPRN